MSKNHVMNIGLMLVSIALFFLAIEIGLRVTGLQTTKPNPPAIYQSSDNPNISYELRPNLDSVKAYKATVSTDENGFRLNSLQPTSNNLQPITAVLGDSITFGYGVNDDETLPAQLSQISSLNSHFLNAAVPGYQLQQQTATYQEKVSKLNPDAVMLVFYWNDLDGLLPGFIDEDGILRAHGWQPGGVECRPITEGILGLLPGKCWLESNSAFYKAFKKLYDTRASKKQQQQERENIEPVAPEKKISDTALNTYARELALLSLELPEDRTFVIWPDNFVHEEERKRLSSIAQTSGFAVVDLYDLFGNNAETLPWDTVHPSPKSLKDASKFIADFLKSTE